LLRNPVPRNSVKEEKVVCGQASALCGAGIHPRTALPRELESAPGSHSTNPAQEDQTTVSFSCLGLTQLITEVMDHFGKACCG